MFSEFEFFTSGNEGSDYAPDAIGSSRILVVTIQNYSGFDPEVELSLVLTKLNLVELS